MIVRDNLNIFKEKVNTLEDAICKYKKSNIVDEKEIYIYILDCLSWFEIAKKNIKIREVGIISGLVYLNNVKKHEKRFVEYRKITKNLYPSTNLYPSDKLFPSSNNVYFNEIKIKVKEENRKQYDNYKKYVQGKEVVTIFKNVYRILKSTRN